MPPPDMDRSLGDYQLKELILETPLAYRWLGEQVSVGRQVVVDELKPEMADQRGEFLANVRAKAAAKHPLIASVYEAVDEGEHCYFAHEHLPGATLAARRLVDEPIKPADLAQLLHRVAKVYRQFEEQGQSTTPLGLEHLHLDSDGVLRIDNLVTHHDRSECEMDRDMGYLGRALPPLVAEGQPGGTRMLTLLSWMRGETVEEPLTWEQVIELCERIEQQLADPPAQAAAGEVVAPVEKRPTALIAVAGVLALLVVLVTALRMRPEATEVVRARVDLPGPVRIAGGTHLRADGTTVEVPAFRMAAHEVTIAQYAEFLAILETLAASGRDTIFDHRDQPADKGSHQPDDWEAMLQAARVGGDWKGRLVTLDSPVVGVDWWDAVAYCEWAHGRLPVQDEWLLAVGDAEMPAAGWGPVDPLTADRSAQGVLNLAGSVSEWSRRPVANPANPLGEKKWLLLGGNSLQEGGNARSLEWVDDRSLRRPDLGFRVVFEDE